MLHLCKCFSDAATSNKNLVINLTLNIYIMLRCRVLLATSGFSWSQGTKRDKFLWLSPEIKEFPSLEGKEIDKEKLGF